MGRNLRCILVGVSLGAVAAVAGAASPGDVVITEIMQNPGAVGDSQGEWVELYNPGGASVDIDGWTIGDGEGESHTIDAGGSLTLAPGGFVVLGRSSDTAVNGGSPVDYAYGGGVVLGNGADRVVIRDGSVTIDSVAYDGGPLFPDPAGASMELSDPGADNNTGPNWEENVTDLFGDGDYGTPGGVNSSWGAPSGPPVIEETMHFPSYPASTDSVLVSARVTDDQVVSGVSLYYRSGGGAFSLVPMTDTGASLYDGWVPPFPDGTTVEYYLCATDNGGDASYDPPGAPGALYDYRVEDTLPAVAINEVLADPPGDVNGDGAFDSYGDEFIELYNAGAETVDLSGWVLSDDDAPGSEFVFPAGTLLEPGGFITLFGGGSPTGLPGPVFVDDGRIGNGLSNSGDTIFLSRGGELVDQVTFAAEGSHDESMIRLPDGFGGWTRPSVEGLGWSSSPQRSNGDGATETDFTSWGAVKSLFFDGE